MRTIKEMIGKAPLFVTILVAFCLCLCCEAAEGGSKDGRATEDPAVTVLPPAAERADLKFKQTSVIELSEKGGSLRSVPAIAVDDGERTYCLWPNIEVRYRDTGGQWSPVSVLRAGFNGYSYLSKVFDTIGFWRIDHGYAEDSRLDFFGVNSALWDAGKPEHPPKATLSIPSWTLHGKPQQAAAFPGGEDKTFVLFDTLWRKPEVNRRYLGAVLKAEHASPHKNQAGMARNACLNCTLSSTMR